MHEFPKNYNFSEVEKKWQRIWLESNIYAWDKNGVDNFTIDTPPPTVSGELHIGHVYSYVQTDFIARFNRMMGKNIFYPMGFDDNGLPTERLVEKKKNIRAHQLERAEFVGICREIIEEEEKKFEQLFNDIALSVDWSLKYQTISKISQKLSQSSFLDLLQKGEAYRGAEPILWDPVDQTALAQADVEDKEKPSLMNEIIFHTEDGVELIIATSRPELLPACQCVFYHPDDIRYKHLKGQYAVTPIFEHKIPILEDTLVQQDKGTGLVMCCTFGDQTDILWWKHHKLGAKIIINKQGVLNHEADFLAGLKVNAARIKILEVLKERNLLKKQTEITSNVKCAERSGAPLEILMHDQWFIKTIEHKEALLQRSNELKWHPKSMKIKLDNWINGIAFDWCISRSRYFGVPFPIWYSKRAGEEGKILLPEISQLPVDPLRDLPQGYARDEVEPDLDVMDTWATSSITPQLAYNCHPQARSGSKSPGNKILNQVQDDGNSRVVPFTLRPQAHEIIRTWAFYTLLKAHLHNDCLPWENIMVSGWCLASDKTKMSKSKGNIITPHNLLASYGSDVVRYWAASSKLGADTAYSEDVLKAGKRFANKLWNAAKFVAGHFDKILDVDKTKISRDKIINQIDKWLLTKIKELAQNITSLLQAYEYASAISSLEQFFFSDFCDNYLEIIKTRCYDEQNQDPNGSYSARLTIYYSFEVILKLLAPFMPHISEEIYRLLYNRHPELDSGSESTIREIPKRVRDDVQVRDDMNSIHQKGSWPDLSHIELTFEKKEIDTMLEILDLARKIKSQKNLSVKAPIKSLEIENIDLSNDVIQDLANVISAENVILTKDSLAQNHQNDEEIHKLENCYVRLHHTNL
jgi:valyl-tRNA synthetase